MTALMTALIAERPTMPQRMGSPLSYRDGAAHCTLVATTPAESPTLWQDYLDGALANYRKYGVGSVLDIDEVCDGRSTSLFFAAVADDGQVLGGVRTQGPYTCAEQSHAIAEWAGDPGQPEVRRMISERLAFGVIEIKTAWVSDTAQYRHELADSIPRTAVHAATLLGARYAFATSAVHTLQRWTTTGSEVVGSLIPVPYPDERYRTTMIWLDRWTFAQQAAAWQLQEIMAESAQLSGADRPNETPLLAAVGTW